MFFVGAFLFAVVAAAMICVVIPQKADYNRLDKIGFISNIILSVLYVPMSLYGTFYIFAVDRMSLYSATIQKIIALMIKIGVTLPFISVLGIVLSVVFRKRGKRIASFVIQFVPLVLFAIVVATLTLIGS